MSLCLHGTFFREFAFYHKAWINLESVQTNNAHPICLWVACVKAGSHLAARVQAFSVFLCPEIEPLLPMRCVDTWCFTQHKRKKIETWSNFLAYHAFLVLFRGRFTTPNMHTHTHSHLYNAKCDSAFMPAGRYPQPGVHVRRQDGGRAGAVLLHVLRQLPLWVRAGGIFPEHQVLSERRGGVACVASPV